MSIENKNVVSNLKSSVPSTESVIKPEAQDDDSAIRLESSTTEISQKEVEVVPKTFKPKGRSFRPRAQESTSTGFIMDAPAVYGIGCDGTMMDMFNKPVLKD